MPRRSEEFGRGHNRGGRRKGGGEALCAAEGGGRLEGRRRGTEIKVEAGPAQHDYSRWVVLGTTQQENGRWGQCDTMVTLVAWLTFSFLKNPIIFWPLGVLK